MASIVKQDELPQAIREMAKIANDFTFNVAAFCPKHLAGNVGRFSNGSTIQFLLTT